jgi:hypothetical protein
MAPDMTHYRMSLSLLLVSEEKDSIRKKIIDLPQATDK